MGRKKTEAELRIDIARVFYDGTYARSWYSFDEARAIVHPSKAAPEGFHECFVGSLKGGLYLHDLHTTVAVAFEGADAVIAALRKQPDAALDLLTVSDSELPT